MPKVGQFGLTDGAFGVQERTELLQITGVGRERMLAQPFFVPDVLEKIGSARRPVGIHRIHLIAMITAMIKATHGNRTYHKNFGSDP